MERFVFTTPRQVPWFACGDLEAPETLVMVLHGLGQRAEQVASIMPTVPGTVFVLPEALGRYLPRPGAPKSGASWSTGDDGALDGEDNQRYLDALLEAVSARWPTSRRMLLGFSQGGLTVSRWLARSPQRFDRVVMWASVVPPDVDIAAFREGLGDAELVLVGGEQDRFITPQIVDWMRQRLDEGGLHWRPHTYAGDHVIVPDVLAEVVA